jgi:HAT1-interacting factor 1
MVEEASASEASVTMAAPNPLETQTSNEATIQSNAQGGTESTCNNINHNSNSAAEGSSAGDREKSLEFADELMEKGSKAIKDNDFSEAAECFSRALEIRFRYFLLLPFAFIFFIFFFIRRLLTQKLWGLAEC